MEPDIVGKTKEFIFSLDESGETLSHVSVKDEVGEFVISASFESGETMRNIPVAPDTQEKLYMCYKDHFQKVYNMIQLSEDVYIRSGSLSIPVNLSLDHSSIYGEKVSFMIGISVDISYVDTEKLCQAFCSSVKEQFSIPLTESDIIAYKYYFSDFEPNSVSDIRGEIETAYPYMVYSDVTYTQFMEKVEDMACFYRDDVYLDTSDLLCEMGEFVMSDVISRTMSVSSSEYIVEGEAICVGDNDYDETDFAMYYVHIPLECIS